jgi:drug/metabolite transporter (DMT)-like permease
MIILNHRILLLQWLALYLSIIGIAIVQYEQQESTRQNLSAESGNLIIGFAAVITMCWTSAIAGVCELCQDI